ncbi:hypothetical protein H310_06327 [Aphanomyces invadans]|uniref:BED-type domain-containing protein n=1 Tax=Aphanomyces invadans TaxID=157072 RepID=A0A024U5M7_9STRA|nr:hypothetical protein H310_06327 [Aphanomyces invadans]ETW01721.1 hypothetical protein H310_06327 [Aphanomyces invadans]|eukprot:XP_008869569.1 hypothetical protein H310_06327 [Aphanomyces invadans]
MSQASSPPLSPRQLPEDAASDALEVESQLDEIMTVLSADDVEIMEHPPSVQPMPVKRGRSISTMWTLFTDDPAPHKAKSARCKHCKTLINHHKKCEAAKTHLNYYSNFARS